MLGCRVVDAPMKTNVKLLQDKEKILNDSGKYLRLVRKLNYLIVIKPDIAFVVSTMS